MIVILDIDETLVHSTKIDKNGDFSFNKKGSRFGIAGYSVEKRPYLDFFLEKILNDEYYRVGVWSAGSYTYVHEIISRIVPHKERLEFIMTLNDCNELRDKPLSKVRARYNDELTVHDFIIIDDRKGVTGHDELNHLQILEFLGDPNDSELVKLWEYLDSKRYHTSEHIVANWA